MVKLEYSTYFTKQLHLWLIYVYFFSFHINNILHKNPVSLIAASAALSACSCLCRVLIGALYTPGSCLITPAIYMKLSVNIENRWKWIRTKWYADNRQELQTGTKTVINTVTPNVCWCNFHYEYNNHRLCFFFQMYINPRQSHGVFSTQNII